MAEEISGQVCLTNLDNIDTLGTSNREQPKQRTKENKHHGNREQSRRTGNRE